jgi:DNA-binding beta-propeller fold protein YncE
MNAFFALFSPLFIIGRAPVFQVMLIERHSGKTVGSWGKDAFYMPHGLTVDATGNVWVTDCGLHQVILVINY